MHVPADDDVTAAHNSVNSVTTDSVIVTSCDTTLRHDKASYQNLLSSAVNKLHCVWCTHIAYVYVAVYTNRVVAGRCSQRHFTAACQ